MLVLSGVQTETPAQLAIRNEQRRKQKLPKVSRLKLPQPFYRESVKKTLVVRLGACTHGRQKRCNWSMVWPLSCHISGDCGEAGYGGGIYPRHHDRLSRLLIASHYGCMVQV